MGILLGLANALVLATAGTQLNRLKEVNTYIVNWVRFVVGTIILGSLVTVFSQWELPRLSFWLILLFFIVPADFMGTFCWSRAYQRGEQSLIGPLFALSVVFAVPIGFVVFGELPSPLGIGGIVVILVGVFVVGWKFDRTNMWQMPTKIFQASGSWYMISAAFFGSLVLTGAKAAIHLTSPILAGFFNAFILFIIATFFLIKIPAPFTELRGKWRHVLGVAIADTLDILFSYLALSLLFLGYFAAVKRMSFVFDVIFGRLFSGEKETLRRLIGAVIAVIGVIMIIGAVSH